MPAEMFCYTELHVHGEVGKDALAIWGCFCIPLPTDKCALESGILACVLPGIYTRIRSRHGPFAFFWRHRDYSRTLDTFGVENILAVSRGSRHAPRYRHTRPQ